MFAVTKNKLHPSIKSYVDTPFIKSFKLVKQGGYHKYQFERDGTTSTAHGIHGTLKRRFYPEYKQPRKRGRKRQKKGSSKKIGICVMDRLMEYVKTGKKPRQWMAKLLIEYFEDTLKHTIQAVELPVYVKALGCATQADVITMDSDGVLYMWEVKTGYATSGSRKQGYLTWYTSVPNTKHNHWQLQRYFTCHGLADCIEIDIKNSRVINVFEEAKVVDGIKKRKRHIRCHKSIDFE